MKGIVMFLSAMMVAAPVKASVVSNFSWISSGWQNSATTVLADGTQVTLESTPIPFDDMVPNSARIGDPNDPSPATITLSFSRILEDLRLRINDLDPSKSETLDGFSVIPTGVDGALVLSPSGVVSSIAEDGGGNLYWNGLYASSVSFVFNRCVICGLHLNEFEYTVAPVPSVPTLLLVGIGLVWERRRKLGRSLKVQ